MLMLATLTPLKRRSALITWAVPLRRRDVVVPRCSPIIAGAGDRNAAQDARRGLDVGPDLRPVNDTVSAATAR